FLGSHPATLVTDVGGGAIVGDDNAMRRVAYASLLNFLLRGQVNLGERVVLIKQGVSALAIIGERDAAGIRGPRAVEGSAGSGVGTYGAVRKAGNERAVRRHADLGIVFEQAGIVDVRDGNIAAVLAEHKMLAVGRIRDAAVAAA